MTQKFSLSQMAYVFVPLVVVVVIAFGVFGIPFTDAQSDEDTCGAGRIARGWDSTDFCNTSINLDEVLSGGVGRDGIPAVTNPDMETVDEARDWLVDRSPVIAFEIDGEARAYPQAILMWHEIANDVVAGVPVAVTFCPLCNSSIVFDRRVNGETLEFGVSGNLRNSDMIMYDRTTFSWWQQFVGEGIVGFYNETLLDIIPSQVVGFGAFAERYPDGLVMSRDTGTRRSYGINPYTGLDSNRSGVTSLFRGEYDERLPSRSRVLAGVVDDIPMAYPLEALVNDMVINDTIGTVPVVAMWQSGVASSLDESDIDTSRDIGTSALYSRDVDGRVLTFRYDEVNQVIVDAETGSIWNLFGESIQGELEGTQLEQIVATAHFWFAWAAFYPETEIYDIE
ncbi:MAG: DUF3179 domain-containing protein [Anaerolineae bacterium]|nr:DUF3179 domain-containing protein [Anaerolineae bacterium]